MKVALIDADKFKFIGREGESFFTILKKIDGYIEQIMKATQCTHYMLFLTKGKESLKYKIYPEYKSNRKDKVLPRYYHAIKEYLKSEYYAYDSVELEADDLIGLNWGYWCEQANTTEGVSKPIICTNDSDFTTIEGTHYNFSNNSWSYITPEDAEFNFFKYVLCGQLSKDFIPPAYKGMGEVRATNYLKNKPKEESYWSWVIKAFRDGVSKELCGKKFTQTKGYHWFEDFIRNVNLMSILTNQIDCTTFNVDYDKHIFKPILYTKKEIEIPIL